jgi:hypothetical protein
MSAGFGWRAVTRLASLLVALLAALALAAAASADPTRTVTVQTGPGTSGTDPNVQASTDGTTWYQAYEITPNARYSTLPGTGWDSAAPNGNTGLGTFYYQTTISIPSNAVNPTLSGAFYSDNQGTAYVNGTQVAQNNPCGGGTPEYADYGFQGAAPTSFSAALSPGENTLSFSVNNCGAVSGLDFTATATYTLYPTDKDQCKDGGWQNFTDASGTAFKNQGDCVSYVATGGRNTAAG